MSAADRMRRYRLRMAGRRDGIRRVCGVCGAFLSIHNDPKSHTCAACYRTHGETCKRGHSLDEYGVAATRGDRVTVTCGECKRERDRGYARSRRVKVVSKSASKWESAS